jgi:hypothetical protein
MVAGGNKKVRGSELFGYMAVYSSVGMKNPRNSNLTKTDRKKHEYSEP